MKNDGDIVYMAFREYMDENHIKVKDLVAPLGVTPAAVYPYLREGRPFPMRWTLKWRKHFNLTPEQVDEYFYRQVKA